MAFLSSISISHVEYLRFDADFYHPKYLQELETWRTLDDRIRVAKLSHLISAPVRTGRTPSSRHIKEEDEIVPFIKTDGIREGRINFDSAGALPKRVLNETDFIPADSVVVTIIGATPEIVGMAAIVRDADPRCVTNQNVAVITTNSKCDPYFLTAYFQTSFGRDQLWRHSRRTEQVNLNCREVERVLVPTPDISLQNEIGDMVRASFAATDDSESLYTQAQQLLESELGLDKLCFDKPVGYTARFSELELSRRADAEFFNPKLRYFQQMISKNHSIRPITDFVLILKFSNPPYSDIGLPIITQKHLGKISPDNYGDDLVARDAWVQANPLATIRNYDLLYYSVGAYLGKTNIWLSDDKAVHASFITMLRPFDPEESGFLHVLLNSKYGILQSRCFQSGTSQPYIYPKDIKRFLMPLISKPLRRQIHELVIESFSNLKESKQLLDQAKSRVEQLIEEAVRA
jgi:type I restriction enzyme S subunit